MKTAKIGCHSTHIQKSINQRLLLIGICISIFLIGLILSGCASHKNVSKSSGTIAVHSDLSTENSEFSKLRVSQQDVHTGSNKTITSDESKTDETIEETTTKTKFSAPDSTGKQYPTETETTNRKTKRGDKKNSQTSSESYDSDANKLTDNSESGKTAKSKDKGKFNQTQKESTDTVTSVETPGWIIIVAAILVIGILFLVYLMLKRYKIIK